MNIILFDEKESLTSIPAEDVRAKHIREILKLKPGDSFEGGIINRHYARFTVKEINGKEILMEPEILKKEVKAEYPISLFSSIIRPIDARRIFKNLSVIGVEKIFMGKTDKTEKSYSDGKLWSEDKYFPLLLEGAQQGFTPYIPEVNIHYSLDTFLKKRACEFDNLIALDNYRYTVSLNNAELKPGKTLMAVGGERGWSDRERDLLEEYGFTMCSMGNRVLRTEQACLCGFAILASRWWN